MHVEAYSFSQWVLELQEGDQLLGTSLAGLVLLQPGLSPDSCVSSSPCFLLLLLSLRMFPCMRDGLCEMLLGEIPVAHGGCGMGSS